MNDAEIKQKAVRDYRRGERLEDIAVRYGISFGTVSIWARQAGIKKRRQGCTIKKRPSPRELEIVAAVRGMKDGKPTIKEIGQRYAIETRAGIWRIFYKWKDWRPHIPFKKGDTVRFMGGDFEVLKPDVFDGKVRNLKTGQETIISWRVGKERAVKL